MEPNTPPLVMVKVPPVISSMESLLSRALPAKRTISFSICSKESASAFRITGTTKPFGADTATEMSQKSLKRSSLPSICALTAGHSFKATQTALVKKDMKPRPTPCFSLNWSLNLARMSMIGFMFTSLKVVNMAVSFFTATRRRETVFLKEDIFSLRTPLGPEAAATGAA